ncbi:MAG: DNA-processing protein DprA, partial [Rhodanobacteraceae bacterium]
ADSRDFAAQLAAGGLVVTSGMADGVDGAAHEAALDAGGYTVAVLGTGVDQVYPRKHAALAGRIAASGALVSEFPLGCSARAEHFPRRNRIIAGLSLGTLVIEAGLRSGSLITARLAAEQGREVLVVPGSIHNRMKRGCHRLIRDGGQLVEKPDEVRQALAGPARNLASGLVSRLAMEPEAAAPSAEHPASPEQDRLLDALGNDPQSVDVLSQRSGLPASRVSSVLMELELAGDVSLLPGGRYQRLRHGSTSKKA